LAISSSSPQSSLLEIACVWVLRRCDEVECDLAKGWASLRALAHSGGGCSPPW
jgi:hypothetical protein